MAKISYNFLLLLIFANTLPASDVVDSENIITPAERVAQIIAHWDGKRTWMKEGRYVIIDTETTGLSYTDRIVQLTLYEVIDGHFTGQTFNSYFNPDMPSAPHAYKAHRLGYGFLSVQPRFADKFTEIKEFIGDSMLLGHNVSFDIHKLGAEVERIPGASLTVFSKDTMGMAKRDVKRREALQEDSPLGDLTNSPAPKITGASYLTQAERRQHAQDLENRRIDNAIRREQFSIRALQAQSTDESRDERAIRRAHKRTHDEANQPGADENVEPEGFSLEACAKRACTNASRAVAAHGHDLLDLSRRAGIPADRIGVPHDAFHDVATTLGLADGLKDRGGSFAPRQLTFLHGGSNTDDSASFEALDSEAVVMEGVDG